MTILYNPNTPENPSDSLATSQPDFLNNFSQLYEKFKINHVSLDAGATAGNHTFIQLLRQNNSYQTNVGEISVYTKDVEGETDQVFLRYQGNGQEFQYTNYQLYSVTNIPNQTLFFTFLPGKVILYFGNFTKLKDNLLTLHPPIAKKIAGMSFCPSGSTPDFKPKVNIIAAVNGFFTSINVTRGIFENQAAPSCDYLIIGNI